MTTTLTFPGGITVRAGGQLDQPSAGRPDWGVYADSCWRGWPGILLDWPDFDLPAEPDVAITALVSAFARARSGQDILVGCLGGTGRTGTILACFAVLAGVPAEIAVPWVRHRYRPRAVETRAQKDWVVSYFAKAGHVRKRAERARVRMIEAST